MPGSLNEEGYENYWVSSLVQYSIGELTATKVRDGDVFSPRQTIIKTEIPEKTTTLDKS